MGGAYSITAVCSYVRPVHYLLNHDEIVLRSTKIYGLVRNAAGTRICLRTVKNRLRAARLSGRRPYVGVPLTRNNRQERLTWARAHRQWTRRQWNQAVFTDESSFSLNFADGRVSVWRRDGWRTDGSCKRHLTRSVWRRWHYGLGRNFKLC